MFGFLNLNWVLHQQTFCILDPKRSVQRWGKKVSFSQWWRCTTSSSSHLPILHRKIKFPSPVCGEQFLSPPHKWAEVKCKDKAIIGVVTSVCGAPGGIHPLCLCKSLSCDCPELPVLVSRGDTINYTTIAPSQPLFDCHMPDVLQQLFCRARGARFNSLQCSAFPAALQVLCPGTTTSTDKEAACSEDHQVWLSRERPCGSPCSVLQQAHSLISGRKKSSGFGSSDAIRTQLCWQGRSK